MHLTTIFAEITTMQKGRVGNDCERQWFQRKNLYLFVFTLTFISASCLSYSSHIYTNEDPDAWKHCIIFSSWRLNCRRRFPNSTSSHSVWLCIKPSIFRGLYSLQHYLQDSSHNEIVVNSQNVTYKGPKGFNNLFH